MRHLLQQKEPRFLRNQAFIDDGKLRIVDCGNGKELIAKKIIADI